ncbi:unnamed protein product [Musa hybrid cultivar]
MHLFDQHHDMRLDIDNMSYEELLALGERMGNVSTGLSEDAITKCLTEIVYCSSDPIQEDNHEQDSCTIYRTHTKIERPSWEIELQTTFPLQLYREMVAEQEHLSRMHNLCLGRKL